MKQQLKSLQVRMLLPVIAMTTLLVTLLTVLFSVLGIVVAAMFLLVDFDTIQTAVEARLPRKYEWIAAFGLAFSVIWLFLKVLDLILKLKDKDTSSK